MFAQQQGINQRMRNVPQSNTQTSTGGVRSRIGSAIAGVKDKVTGARDKVAGLFKSSEKPTTSGMENVPNVGNSEQTGTTSNFGSALSRAMSVYGTHNTQNSGAQVETPIKTETTPTLEDVPTMSMGEYLYRSGSVGTGRRIGNVISVARNLVNGMINPDGNNASLSEGGRRQMVGATLAHHDRTGKYAINDTDHQLLGGMSGHSGTEFRQDSGNNQGSVGVSGYISQAANAPYHNIFGQSGYTSSSGERFSPTEDGYTFNNVWDGDKARALKDGEGSMSLIDAIRAGYNAYKSGSGVKAAIETAASQRGVNVGAGKSTYVDEDDFQRYQDEYNNYINMSPEERAKINKRFGYN